MKNQLFAVRLLLGSLCVIAMSLPLAASAQTISTWIGGGSDNNWSTTGNWSGAGVPTGNTGNNVVVFSGTNRPNTVNNLGNWSRSFGQMYFASDAASFTLSGDNFGFLPYLGSGTQQIFQNSVNTQTIGVGEFSFRSDADSRINLNAGDLVISSANMYIDSASSVRSLYVTGNDATRRTVTFAGNVNKGGTNADPDMYIQGNKRALVTGSLTFGTGNDASVFIDDGVLQFSGAGTMTGGRPAIGSTGGSGNAAVWLDTAGATFARQLEVRNGSSGRRTIGGLNTSGTVTFSGDFAGSTSNFDLAAATGGAAVFGGVRNFTSTVHVNRPDGATTYGGTVILSGTTNSTDGVGVYGGTLQFSDFNQLGSGYFAFEQDTGDSGTLRYTGGSTSVTKQIWSNKAGQTRAAIDVSQAGTTLAWTQSGGDFNRNLTKVGAGTLAFNGPITGAGGSVAVEAGMLILTGSTNSYAGGTVVSAGTLEVSANGSQGGSPSALGTGTVSIASGGQVKYWLSLSGSSTVANPFSLSGGTLHTTDGYNTYSGRITLASGASTISAQYEDTITLSGGLAGSGNVLFTQSGGTGSYAAPTYVLTGTGAHTGTVRVSGSSGGGATKLQLANVNALQGATLDMATGDTGAVEFTVAGNNTYNVGGLAGSRNLAFGSNALSIGSNGQSTTYSGTLSGSGLFTKVGSGTLTLSGSNSYSGGTTVSAGTLQVDGSIAGPLAVAAAGTLSGSGSVGGNATIAGIHSPGNSPGAQTFNANLTYDAGAVVNWELIANTTGSAGTNYDQIAVGGNLSFAGSTTLALAFGGTVVWADPFWGVNRSWMVYDLSTGAVTGISNLVLGGSLLDSLGNSLSPTGRGYFTTSVSGQDVMLNFVAVPEPSTWAMALAGLACGGWMMRGRRRSS
jgi:autotransporter-associated beta strand protein